MKMLQVQSLTPEKFKHYGDYAHLPGASGYYIGSPPITFYRDILIQSLPDAKIAFSTLRIEPREPVVDCSEYHNYTAEMLMPLDGDVIIHVAPADPGQQVPLDKIELFIVPRLTMVVVRPGVWHHAPFAIGQQPANILIGLPERAYANDCTVKTIPDSAQLTFAVS